MLYVDVGAADAGVDAFAFGKFERFDGGVDVFFDGSSERADYGCCNGFRDLYNRLEVARGGDRKACLDHVYAEGFQLVGDLDFFYGVELAARGLLAVAEGGVEDLYSVAHGMWSLWCCK